MRTLCVLTGILLFAATMASAVMTTITVLGPDTQPVAGAKVIIKYSPYARKDNTELLTDAEGCVQTELETAPGEYPPVAIVYQPGMGLANTAIRTPTLTVQLGHAATVTGTVVDAVGAPVAGAKIRLLSFSENAGGSGYLILHIPAIAETFTTVTAADGSWQLNNLPTRGSAELRFEHPQFPSQLIQVALSAQRISPVQITAEAGATIAGRAVNGEGEPAEGVQIAICSIEKSAMGGSHAATSGADGRFRAENLLAGHYQLLTNNDPDAKWLLATPVKSIVAYAGKETITEDIVVQATAVITGCVLDLETQEPIADTTVLIRDNRGPRPRSNSATTAADGGFRIAVLPGSYELQTVVTGRNRVPEVIAATVLAGETKTITLHFDNGKTLTGTAVDEHGKPVAGLPIEAKNLCGRCGKNGCNADRKVSTSADAQGKFLLSGLDAGPLLLSLRCPEWTLGTPLYLAKVDAHPLTLTVRRAETHTLTGQVLDTEGQPVAGAQVTVNIDMRENDGNSASVGSPATPIVTDADGRYTVASRDKDIVWIMWVRKEGYRPARSAVFTLYDGDVYSMVKLDGTLSGQIVGTDGKPLAGVTVVSLEGGVDLRRRSKADGTFTLTGIPRGKTSVLAVSPTMSGLWWGETGATGVTITVTPHQPDDDITGAKVLQAWMQHGCPERDAMAALFLDEGFGTALQVWSADGSAMTDKARATLLQMYARLNPSETAKIAAAQLDLISSPRERFATAIAVGMAVAKIDPLLGEHCYAVAAMHASPPDQTEKFARAWRLIELAHALRHDTEVAKMLDDLLVLARTMNLRDTALAQVIETAAKINAQQAEQLLDELPAARRRSAIMAAIPLIAAYDTKTAERWQAKLTEPDQELLESRNEQARYAPEAMRALAQIDPAAALAQAKAIQNKGLRLPALLAVLPYQPQEVTLRECREISADFYVFAMQKFHTLAMTARYVYNHDPEVGRALFATTYLGIRAQYLPALLGSIPAFAYYAAPADPVEARILLEVGLVNMREQKPSATPTASAQYALAMMAFNQRRALELANAVPTAKNQAYLALMRYLRASDEERLWNLFEQN